MKKVTGEEESEEEKKGRKKKFWLGSMYWGLFVCLFDKAVSMLLRVAYREENEPEMPL